jgi:hypothetical protein
MIARLCSLLKISRPQGDGMLRVDGTSVPVDGTPGYQTGCLYQRTNGGTGTSLYVNEGTLKSCAFKAVKTS